jgi:hypothetical protein
MAQRVRLKLQVEFIARDEAAANGSILRLPGELATSVEYGRLGTRALTGVLQGSVQVEVLEKDSTPL